MLLCPIPQIHRYWHKVLLITLEEWVTVRNNFQINLIGGLMQKILTLFGTQTYTNVILTLIFLLLSFFVIDFYSLQRPTFHAIPVTVVGSVSVHGPLLPLFPETKPVKVEIVR